MPVELDCKTKSFSKDPYSKNSQMSDPTGILWKPGGGGESHLQKVESWNSKTAYHFFSPAKSKFYAPS